MNVTKCINGHFFDSDKYQLCPHCGAVSVNGTPPAATETKKSQISFWGKKKNSANDGNVVEMPDRTIGKTFGVFGEDFEDKKKTEMTLAPKEAETEGLLMCSLCGRTYDSTGNAYCPNCSGQRIVSIIEEDKKAEEGNKNIETEDFKSPHSNNAFNQFALNERVPDCGEKSLRINAADDESKSLQDAVKKAVSGNEGKTVGFFSSGAKDNKDDIEVSNEPVVGWLVCIKGNHFGDSFNLYAGRNSVGRGETNKINISKDSAVSRNKHAWLTYEPKKRDFYIQPGEGSGLSYLNGETVMETKKLQAKDMLEFGNGLYILIPLCDETFTWEDYIK